MTGSSRKLKYWFAAAAIALFGGMSVFAQSDPKATPARPEITVIAPRPTTRVPAPLPMPGGDTLERSIKVDSSINLSLCVTQGNLKVNGWNRNEVRVFVRNGTKFGFKVQQKSQKSGDPVWIMVASDGSAGKYGSPNECVWGDEIEIDAPVNATLNLKGQEITTTIEGIRKVNVKNAGGDITIREVTDGVTASTYRGDLSVEDSTGAMMLESSTGNILVFDAGPSEIGDIFTAKTASGAVALQNVAHRQMEVKSVSGTVAFNGELLNGGSYSFGTTNGSIRLMLPQNTSCTVSATYGFGTFNSELPIKILTENISEGPVKSMVGKLGSGDATLKLTTSNGSIQVKKQ
jgi:hypothetical protein